MFRFFVFFRTLCLFPWKKFLMLTRALFRIFSIITPVFSITILQKCCYVQYPEQPSAHPSYSHYYLLSPSTLFFFFCTSYCFLHILLLLFFFFFFCTSFLHILLSFCTSYCFFAHLIVLHFFLFHCTFYSYFSFSYHMYALVLCYFI